MLYHLFEYLKNNGYDFPGSGLLQYISVRGIACNVIAILTALIAGRCIIGWLRKRQIGETIRDLGLAGDEKKVGTPTMGGLIIIVSTLVPVLLFGNFNNVNTILLVVATVWLGLTGFMDDYIKVFRKNKNGLPGKFKIVAQASLGLVVGLTMCFSSQVGFYSKTQTESEEITLSELGDSFTSESGQAKIAPSSIRNEAKTTIPFVKNNEFSYRSLVPFKGRAAEIAEWVLYILVIIFIITACSNGTNLADGMDGMATGVSAIVGATLGILAYVSGHYGFADYLNIMYIPNSGEITVFILALVGALVGFLWYNSYPAQVFMGDTGSLALGGIIGVCAVMIRKEFLLPILCGIFLVESLSVILQTAWFKHTRKKTGTGVRIFRMAPLHHHFQKENPDALLQSPRRLQHENKIVVRFWIISLILAVLTVVTLKIR
ncbi:MAG: phospho-N-acetylmuramoyl-pentapeptide-transferase [Bacteroidales bacterium]|nr:phospho-N-acetylmuramoyl-pentapeptide-transferase [Bacteroidales bacterium]